MRWEKATERPRVPPSPILWKVKPASKSAILKELVGNSVNYLGYWKGGLHGRVHFYFDSESFRNMDDGFFRRLRNSASAAEDISRMMQRSTRQLALVSAALDQAHEMNKQQLLVAINEFKKALSEDFAYALIGDIGTRRLQDYLRAYLEGIGVDPSCFADLTQPDELTWTQKEERSIKRIVAAIEDYGVVELYSRADSAGDNQEGHPEIDKMLDRHHRRFHWVGFEYIGPGQSKIDVVDKIRNALAKNRRSQVKRMKCPVIDAEHRQYFRLLRFFSWHKDHRNYLEAVAFTRLKKTFESIAERTGLSLEDIYFLHPDEFEGLLLSGTVPKGIAERQQHYLVVSTGEGEKSLSGADAKKVFRSLNKVITQCSEIKGLVAHPGLVRGRVRILRDSNESHKLKNGEILVCGMTTPDYFSALSKAAAIVTDEGGITCHAAIVSRELNVPCIIGTKTATQMLKDGDIVEVDANKGIVSKIDD
jgi:phosphohistidine swiveling domain-containing protein